MRGGFVATSALLIGGSTGITPLYAVTLALGYTSPESALRRLSLVYGNSDAASILCRADLAHAVLSSDAARCEGM